MSPEKRLSVAINLAVGLGVVFFTVLALAFVNSRVPDSKALRAAEKQGYTSVQVVGRNWLTPFLHGCTSYNSVQFDMRAINPEGEEEEIIVCARHHKPSYVKSN